MGADDADREFQRGVLPVGHAPVVTQPSHAEKGIALIACEVRVAGYRSAGRVRASGGRGTDWLGALFHVQIGPFASKKDADTMRTRLQGDGYNNAIVK